MNPKFEELKVSGDLPSPCGVGMSILNLTQSEDFSTDDLVATIQTDPALTGRLLKMANSARSAGVSAIATIDEATMRLGSNAVRNVALGFSLMSGNRTGRCAGFDYDTYWARSVFAGVAAQALAAEAGRISTAEAFVCGLLSNVGSLALASAHPETYGALIQECAGQPESACLHAERARFEITRHEVSRAMLAEWGLPQSISMAIATHRDRREDNATIADLPSVVWGAGVLARFCVGSMEERVRTLFEFDQVRTALDVTDDNFFGLCESISVEFQEMGRLMDIPTLVASELQEMYHRVRDLCEARSFARTDREPIPGKDIIHEPTVDHDSEGAHVDVRPDGDDFGNWESARILAIEDNNLCLRVLVRELEKTGHEVRTASDGRSGLQLALEWNPQIVITDWVMPEMDGIELCKALRRFETGREMYLIILTGNEEEDQIVHAFNAGADDHVLKPFRPRLLAARVRAGMRVVKLQERVAADRAKMQQQVAELGVLTRRLEQATLTDSLTGLPNRRYAMAHLEDEWNRAREEGTPLAVIMADIDHFKNVNDEYGHDAGDYVLQEVGRVLCTTLRGNEKVCRMGGEEFLVVVSGSDLEGAMGCADRLRRMLESQVIEGNTFSRSVTVSMGVAELRPDMATPFDLVKVADLGAYAAKKGGRNCVRSEQLTPTGVA